MIRMNELYGYPKWKKLCVLIISLLYKKQLKNQKI